MSKKHNERKHDHKATKIIKASLFGIVMALPLLAVFSTSMYAICNKNAKDSFKGSYTYIYDYGQLANLIPYETPQLYINDAGIRTWKATNDSYKRTYIYQYDNTSAYAGLIFTNVDKNSIEIEATTDITKEYVNTIIIYNNKIHLYDTMFTDNMYVNMDSSAQRLYDYTTRQQLEIPQVITTNRIKFTALSNTLRYGQTNNGTFNGQIIYNKLSSYDNAVEDSTLTSAFYIGTEQVWHSPLFSWVMNGPFFNGIAKFTNIFGIPNQTFFSNLLVYWLTMTCIYVIIDVIIETFIWLSHLLFERNERL